LRCFISKGTASLMVDNSLRKRFFSRELLARKELNQRGARRKRAWYETVWVGSKTVGALVSADVAGVFLLCPIGLAEVTF
jgi:hypothetical protein